MITANMVKEASRDLATKLKGRKHPLCIELIRLSEVQVLKIRQAAYPDMAPQMIGGRLQEVRPIQLPEGFDVESVEACPGDCDLLETYASQLLSEGIV